MVVAAPGATETRAATLVTILAWIENLVTHCLRNPDCARAGCRDSRKLIRARFNGSLRIGGLVGTASSPPCFEAMCSQWEIELSISSRFIVERKSILRFVPGRRHWISMIIGGAGSGLVVNWVKLSVSKTPSQRAGISVSCAL